jgi:hypothetical protein
MYLGNGDEAAALQTMRYSGNELFSDGEILDSYRKITSSAERKVA